MENLSGELNGIGGAPGVEASRARGGGWAEGCHGSCTERLRRLAPLVNGGCSVPDLLKLFVRLYEI